MDKMLVEKFFAATFMAFFAALVFTPGTALSGSLDTAYQSLQKYPGNPLFTPTYEKSNQAVHPDVLYFENGWGNDTGGHSWNYWMGVTPYPDGVDDYENPSVLVSNDGISWYVPSGLKNPINDTPYVGTHFDDPELVYDSSSNVLWYYYNDNATLVRRQSSVDGVNWSPSQTFDIHDSQLSPTIIMEGGVWYMWRVDSDSSPNFIKLYNSSDGIAWTYVATVNAIAPDGRDLWHLDVIKYGDIYWMTLVTADMGTGGSNAKLFYGSSPDKISWSFWPNQIIRLGSSGSWEDSYMYRSSSVVVGDELKVFYSARRASDRSWHVGLATQGISTPVTTTTTTAPTTTTLPGTSCTPGHHDQCSRACSSKCPAGVYGCCDGCNIGQCDSTSGKCYCLYSTSYCGGSPTYQVGSACIQTSTTTTTTTAPTTTTTSTPTTTTTSTTTTLPSGTRCWSASYQYLYANPAQAKKFCECATGTYGYKSYVSYGIKKAVTYYYLDTANNRNWSVSSRSSPNPVYRVVCPNGGTYLTNQNYYR